MEKALFILGACIFLLTGCYSLESEINHCADWCCGNKNPNYPRYFGPPKNFCNVSPYHQQTIYSSNGEANYDTYRILKPCIKCLPNGMIPPMRLN